MAELQPVAIFHDIPLDGLSALAARGAARTFRKGTVLMRQGQASDTMYVILRGLVSVERTHPALIESIELARLGPGEVVGEMGLLDGEARSATAIALEDVETMELSAQALTETMLEHPPVARALLRILSQRIRSTNELLEHAMRVKNEK